MAHEELSRLCFLKNNHKALILSTIEDRHVCIMFILVNYSVMYKMVIVMFSGI